MQIKHPLWALLLAALHGLAGLSILLISSWFIAASAVAAPSFNYMLPAVLIRGLALLRIASGYAEMWLSHDQLLNKLALTRLKLFESLKNEASFSRGTQTDKLSYQTEDLASIWAGWINQNATAILNLLAITIITVTLLKDFTTLWFVFSATALIIYSAVLLQSRKIAIEQLTLRASLEHEIEHHFDAADIWHMYEKVSHPISSALYRNSQKQQKTIEYAISGLLLVSLSVLFFILLQTSAKGLMQPIHLVLPMALLASVDWFGKTFYSANRLQAFWLAKANLPSGKFKAAKTQRKTDLVSSLAINHFKPENAKHRPVSFTLEVGQTLLLEGNSGAGKTRLLKSLASLLPYSGERLFNKQLTSADEIYEDILYIEQSPYCLSGSLKQNLLIANETASDTKLKQVLQQVNLDNLDYLNEWLGTGGRQLSGGELKRLGLARAILSNKSVLLLDEPFEALDSNNMAVLSELLNSLKQNKLIIIASHIKPKQLTIEQTISLESAKALSAEQTKNTNISL